MRLPGWAGVEQQQQAGTAGQAPKPPPVPTLLHTRAGPVRSIHAYYSTHSPPIHTRKALYLLSRTRIQRATAQHHVPMKPAGKFMSVRTLPSTNTSFCMQIA